jgi:hypothetical protein
VTGRFVRGRTIPAHNLAATLDGIGVLAGKGATMSEIASDAVALDKMTKVDRPAGKVDKWGGGARKFASADLASAAGTRFIPATLATGDSKSNKSMGELATGLGVDAILAVENEMTMSRSDLSLNKIQLVHYGPNPVPKVEGRLYPGWSYNTGMVYGGSVLQLKRPAEVATFEVEKKEMKTTGESFDGYAPLLKVAAVKLAADVAARAAGGE